MKPPMPITRRALLALTAAGAAAPWATAHAVEAWPSRTVRIIVPFAPGGGADISARALAEALAPVLGQAVIVENKPGAGSAVGVTAAAQARDGHTLLMGSNSMVVNPLLRPGLGYDVERDFDAVGMVSAQPLVLVMPASAKPQTVAELVAEAKAQPGRLSAGNSGNGTLAHLTSVLFELQTGTDLISVPYKGESALLPDLLSGQVALGFLNLPSVLPHLKAGKLKALAVSSPQPLAELPSVPTFRTLGLPDLEVQGWAVLVAPRGSIPAPALAQLSTQLAAALSGEAVKSKLNGAGIATWVSTREAAAAALRAEGARWQKVITSRGIKADS
jgi:tripartite-type tricarboxylate transporter receptor subunit TctC